MKDFIKTWFEKAMTTEDVNSRLMFFVHGLVTALAVLLLCIAFIFAVQKEIYPYMVGAAGGSGLAAGVGRFLTKKEGGPPTP